MKLVWFLWSIIDVYLFQTWSIIDVYLFQTSFDLNFGLNFDLFWSERVFPTLIRFVKNASHDIMLIVAFSCMNMKGNYHKLIGCIELLF